MGAVRVAEGCMSAAADTTPQDNNPRMTCSPLPTTFGIALFLTLAVLVVSRTDQNPTGAPISASGLADTEPIMARRFPVIGLPKLHFNDNALEPHMGRTTVSTHYTKHQAGYVTRLNGMLMKMTNAEADSFTQTVSKDGQLLPAYANTSIVTMVILQRGGGALFNMAAQIYNHALYFHLLQPITVTHFGEDAATGAPLPAKVVANPSTFPDATHPLSLLVAAQFGGYDEMLAKLRETAIGHFGSGWAWVVANATLRNGQIDTEHVKLSILATHDAEVPMSTSGGFVLWPILVCDVWEHAYYLDHLNDRNRFFTAWQGLIDWGKVAARFDSKWVERGPTAMGGAAVPAHPSGMVMWRPYPLF